MTRARNHMDCWSGGEECLLNDPHCPMTPFASAQQVRITVRDGWRLKCGCLHLQIAGQPKGSPTFISIPTEHSRPECADKHSEANAYARTYHAGASHA